MIPIDFKESNIVFAKDQKPYLPLPAYIDKKDMRGAIFHCWKMTIKERIKILLTGKLWISVYTFKQPPQPIKPMVDNPFNPPKDR